MADIVNLNRARKKKRAAEKEKTAASNRVKFGRAKSEKANLKKEKELDDRKLDSHRINGDD